MSADMLQQTDNKKLNRKRTNRIYYIKNRNNKEYWTAIKEYRKNRYKTDKAYKHRINMHSIRAQKNNINFKKNHNKYRMIAYYNKHYPDTAWKCCESCRRVLPASIENFPRKIDSADGFFDICIQCTNSRKKMKKYWNEKSEDKYNKLSGNGT